MSCRIELSSRPESEESDDQRLISSSGIEDGARRGWVSLSKGRESTPEGERERDGEGGVESVLDATLLRW